ncbi:type I glutamate--ammonia ligase [Gemmatimonadota bacterium]
MPFTPKEVLDIVKENSVELIDLKFMDFPGLWQHFTVPAGKLDEDAFEAGFGFDGSSIRGWQEIFESDMLVIPDPNTAMLDPFYEARTLSLICDIYDPVTKERYDRCPRYIASKAEAYLKSTGIADLAYFGPEAEFFMLDDVRYSSDHHQSSYLVDSKEGQWNTGREEGGNLGYKLRLKEGYFPVPPHDSMADIRNEMVLTMRSLGIDVEAAHHEVASGGQMEIDIRFGRLLDTADKLMLYKYVVKNVARRHDKSVTFMPKPIYGDNGSGMHIHMSLWNSDSPLFYGEGYANLSEEALYFIGGILRHAPALVSITNPTTNSYKRLVPGYEAPVNLAYSQRNRSAAVRIPVYSQSPASKRIEFRCPDPTCNPYLAFSALLMAGLDGIQNKIHPGDPLDKNIYDLPPEELAGVPSTPASLEEALEHLAADKEFLLKGDVFTESTIDAWINYKMENEVKQMRLRPHPYEFVLYYDV